MRIIVIVVFCFFVTLYVRSLYEYFDDKVTIDEMPNPAILLKQMRTLLDKYDKPEVWNHAASVMDKDPGTLARMQLGLEKPI